MGKVRVRLVDKTLQSESEADVSRICKPHKMLAFSDSLGQRITVLQR